MKIRLPRHWPPWHRHDWHEIERIGRIVTSWCPCGKTKTRVTSDPLIPYAPDQHREAIVNPIQPATVTLPADEVGDYLDDTDMIRNGLWNLEGPQGHPLYALGGDEIWDYVEVEYAWTLHAAEKLAAHGITWDPAKPDTVQLPAAMATADAERIWRSVLDGWDDWVITVVDEARDGAGQAPPDGVRPDDAPGARWVTESIGD